MPIHVVRRAGGALAVATIRRVPDDLRTFLTALEGAGARAASAAVLAHVRSEGPGGPAARLVERAVAEASDRALAALASSVLHRAPFAERRDVLLLAVSRAGPRARNALHRHVFPALHGKSAEFDALYAAVTVSDDARRVSYVAAIREPLARGDADALRDAMRAAGLDPPVPPEGFELVARCIGAGKTFRVGLVRRRADGALHAWKIPADDSPETLADVALAVERSAEWERRGVPGPAAVFAADGRTVLQPFVRGETLRRLIRETQILTDSSDPRHAELVRFLGALAAARVVVRGLNAENLLHDGSGFRAVDAGAVHYARTPRAAFAAQARECRKKWTRWEGAEHAPAIRAFLTKAARDLDYESALARLLRRVGRQSGGRVHGAHDES